MTNGITPINRRKKSTFPYNEKQKPDCVLKPEESTNTNSQDKVRVEGI